MPSGVFNVHDGDSYIEFNAFLREANELSKGRFGAQGAGFADRYLAAVSTGERNAIIQQAERAAMATLFPNYDLQTIDKLYTVFDARRASRIKQHRNQGFVSYMENGQVVNAIFPILERESANIVIIADLRKLKYAIDSHERVLPGLLDGLAIEDLTLRTQKGLSALSTINDIFKTSVLMRLGYTVRNITEAQLSMLAKGFALPAMVAAEDEIRTLRGVLSDLESVTLYHGSPEAAFKLDEARVLATSASPAIAARYSTGFTIHSTENYLQTPTGRPGKITEVTESINDARKTLQQAQKNLTQAQKELSRSGETQWDVNLLQQTIDEQKAIIKRAGARERSAERRAATLDEASDNLLTDMIAAKNAGKEVEMRTPKGWKTVESLDWKQIRLAEEGALEVTPDLFRRSVFRVKGQVNKPVPVRVYGDALYLTKWSDIPLDLRESAFGGKSANYKEWTRNKGWNNPNDPVTKYMRENGFGRAVVQDDKLAGGVSNIVLPEAVDSAGRKRSVERSITQMQERAAVEAAEDLPILEQQMATPKQRRLAKTAARKAARKARTPISPYYTKENVDAMINNGVEDAAENLAKLYTMSHAYLDDISTRLNARSNSCRNKCY
jgi:hypothetical protein